MQQTVVLKKKVSKMFGNGIERIENRWMVGQCMVKRFGYRFYIEFD